MRVHVERQCSLQLAPCSSSSCFLLLLPLTPYGFLDVATNEYMSAAFLEAPLSHGAAL
jgi:hypothetical protein